MSQQGEQAHKVLVAFPSTSNTEGYKGPKHSHFHLALLEVLERTKYSQKGRVTSARSPCHAEWFSPGSPSAHRPFGLPPR